MSRRAVHERSDPLCPAEQAIARYGSLEAAVEHSGLPGHLLLQAWRRMSAAAATSEMARPVHKASDPAPCGTYAAYKRHLRRQEPIDLQCQSAAYLANAGTAEARRRKKAAP